MTAAIPVFKAVSQMQLAPGSTVTIPDVSWEEFESILQELGQKRTTRIAYSQGALEIMAPLPEHEIPKDLISDIVKILLKAKDIRYQPFGSTTFKRQGVAGVEPDACFYIQNYQQMIGHRRLQPDDPPPDLAIETDVTSKTTLDAYEAIGILPAREYLKLIIDESGNIIKGLFYDNVRDFDVDNEVNREIEATIKSDEHKSFVLYNNGITIVAEDINVVGDKMTVTDYQIVNGCQTSHVLYYNEKSIDDALYIPIKIIALARDSRLKNNIIKANNRQTPVKLEELEALTDFQKKLEEYYKSLPEDKQLFYERRPRQFNGIQGVEKIRIVDISSQMRCFASMFLDQAHNAGRYRANLQDETRNKIFLSNHDPIGYYVSAYAKFRLDALFRKKQMDGKYSPFKYHMLNIFRIQVSGNDMPAIYSNKFIKYCEKIEEILSDENKSKEAFLKTTAIIDRAVNGNYDRASAKTVTFLRNIKDFLV